MILSALIGCSELGCDMYEARCVCVCVFVSMCICFLMQQCTALLREKKRKKTRPNEELTWSASGRIDNELTCSFHCSSTTSFKEKIHRAVEGREANASEGEPQRPAKDFCRYSTPPDPLINGSNSWMRALVTSVFRACFSKEIYS